MPILKEEITERKKKTQNETDEDSRNFVTRQKGNDFMLIFHNVVYPT